MQLTFILYLTIRFNALSKNFFLQIIVKKNKKKIINDDLQQIHQYKHLLIVANTNA